MVLQGQAALAALQQCSRSTPAQVRAAWSPNAAEIRALESKLGPVLQAALKQWRSGKLELRLDDYRRQYVGIVHRDGTRSIYVNGFYHDTMDPSEQSRDSTRWREEPVVVCDGGAGFFGVEYHPDTGTFGRLEFNGPA
ncbi:MAG: hypothetical protein JO306_11190 [Gemmatimonadetes bacterium]|nr:hypothetical protein [Gemmatimonadota bacterium]